MQSVKEYVGHLLAEVISPALYVRQQGVQVDQGVSVEVFECVEVLSFQRVDEEKRIGVYAYIRFGAFVLIGVLGFASVNDLGCGRVFRFPYYTFVLVDFVAWM